MYQIHHLYNFSRSFPTLPIKTLTDLLIPYMVNRKLYNYHLLGQNNKSVLIPNETYIKFININDAFSLEYLEDHISAGGLLIDCGKFIGGKFVGINLEDEWQWLMVLVKKSDINNIRPNKNIKIVKNKNSNSLIFFVDLSKNYIFSCPIRKNKNDLTTTRLK